MARRSESGRVPHLNPSAYKAMQPGNSDAEFEDSASVGCEKAPRVALADVRPMLPRLCPAPHGPAEIMFHITAMHQRNGFRGSYLNKRLMVRS